jgi:integrase
MASAVEYATAAGPQWQAVYRKPSGRRGSRRGFISQAEALAAAEVLEGDAAAPILAAYRAHLEAQGDTAKHVGRQMALVQECLSACGASSSASLSAAKLAGYVAAKACAGASARWLNARIGAAKAFGAWLWRSGRLPEHPLVGLARQNEAADPRRPRRVPTDEEFGRLLAVCGPARRLLYEAAASSGLRLNELRHVRVADVVLAGRVPHIICRAAFSKRRRQDEQPIPASLATALRTAIAGREAGAPALKVPRRMDRAMRADLRRAGVARETAEGVLDFHGLRHYYGSRLAARGVAPRALQELMRHSSLAQTERYLHTNLMALAEAAAGLDAAPSAASRTA